MKQRGGEGEDAIRRSSKQSSTTSPSHILCTPPPTPTPPPQSPPAAPAAAAPFLRSADSATDAHSMSKSSTAATPAGSSSPSLSLSLLCSFSSAVPPQLLAAAISYSSPIRLSSVLPQTRSNKASLFPSRSELRSFPFRIGDAVVGFPFPGREARIWMGKSPRGASAYTAHGLPFRPHPPTGGSRMRPGKRFLMTPPVAAVLSTAGTRLYTGSRPGGPAASSGAPDVYLNICVSLGKASYLCKIHEARDIECRGKATASHIRSRAPWTIRRARAAPLALF
nr:unnamed protein product [Digitaria exilis]